MLMRLDCASMCGDFAKHNIIGWCSLAKNLVILTSAYASKVGKKFCVRSDSRVFLRGKRKHQGFMTIHRHIQTYLSNISSTRNIE